MTPVPDFYVLLSSLFRQIKDSPEALPVIPENGWPIGSQERQLLVDFQEALITLKAREKGFQEKGFQEKDHTDQKIAGTVTGGNLRPEGERVRMLEQAALLEISQTLASALELKPGLILDQLRMIIEYTHAILYALEDSTLIALAVRSPQALEQRDAIRIPMNGPKTLAVLFNDHRPLRIANVWSDDPTAQFLRSFFNEQAAFLLIDVQAWMWVPLAVKGRVIGGIGIGHTEPDFFTAHHADLALTVANQAAIAMVNADLYEQAQTLAALQERQHLAQNLHDAINQSLFSAALIAEVLPRLWERDPEEARRSLEDLRRLTRGAMAEMRAMLVELRLSALTDAELSDLLRLLGHALTGRTNVPVTLEITGQGVLQEQGKMPADVQVAFYRICQEGLNNIAKHAKASEVTLELKYEADTVELRLHDDGRGFDPAHTLPGHFGLAMMRERAEAVGADLSILSQPGRGTEIVIRWEPQKDEPRV
jgi:signal transduction histidine kinase